MNALRGIRALAVLWLGLVAGLPVQAVDVFKPVYLSEFLAVNRQGLLDDDGGHSGWIELHNAGPDPVNLAGCFLTDNATQLTQWRFPKVVLLPDKYFVVFASGRNRTNDLAHLHVNFRLSGQGNYLALVDPATNVISELAPAPQAADVSDGRVRGEPSLRGHFLKPTPGKPNSSSGTGFAPEVQFSRAGGNFTEPFAVELASAPTGTVIRYTLDGTLPTSQSPVYETPLSLTNSTHLRARSYQTGLLPGPPRSEAYLRLSNNVVSFTSTLPVFILDTLGQNRAVSAQGHFVHLSVHEPVQGKTSLTNPPTLTARAGFRVRGSTSAGMPQSGFALEFMDDFNEPQPRALLGMPADADWILYAPNAYDPVMIHNPFIHQLSRDMGRYSARTRFVEVYVVRSGAAIREAEYYGVYVLEEKIKIGKSRVNIDRLGPEDLAPPQVTGGYLLKFDRVGPGESGVFATGDRGMVYVEPKEQTMLLPQRAPQREYVRKYFTDFEQALFGPEWKDPVRGYASYLDVEAAIDFHILEVLSGNVDAMVLSTYFHKPRDGKIVCGPHWDFDRALGSTDERDADPRQWNTGPFFGGAWWPRLFSDVDFWQRWVDRWQEERQSHFSLTNLNRLIDQLASEVREAQPREYKKWDIQPRGGSYQSEIDHMKDWLASRVNFIDQQLVHPPHLSRAGSSETGGAMLVLAAPANVTVHYTLNGADPRAPGGGLSPGALIYSAPILLKTNVHVVARARDLKQRQTGGPPSTTPWSGPIKTNLVVALP